MRIVIEGHELPGATCVSAGVLLTNVHVGVQVRTTPDHWSEPTRRVLGGRST